MDDLTHTATRDWGYGQPDGPAEYALYYEANTIDGEERWQEVEVDSISEGERLAADLRAKADVGHIRLEQRIDVSCFVGEIPHWDWDYEIINDDL